MRGGCKWELGYGITYVPTYIALIIPLPRGHECRPFGSSHYSCRSPRKEHSRRSCDSVVVSKDNSTHDLQEAYIGIESPIHIYVYIYMLCYVILCYSTLYYIILNMPTRTCAKPRSLGQQDVEGVTGDSTERRLHWSTKARRTFGVPAIAREGGSLMVFRRQNGRNPQHFHSISSRWTWKLLRQDGQFPAMERQLVKKTGVQRMKCRTGAGMDSRQVAG